MTIKAKRWCVVRGGHIGRVFFNEDSAGLCANGGKVRPCTVTVTLPKRKKARAK